MGEKVEMATLKISPLKNSSRRGFTLIEVMVVLGIMSALLVVGLPRLNRNNNNIKKVVRELAVLGKEVRNQARLKNQTFRIAFRMGKENTYWVESAQGSVAARKNEDPDRLNDDDKKELEQKNPFKKVDKFFKKEKPLAGGLLLKKIETQSSPESKTEGVSYIYFTPEGLVEKSVVQIGDKDQLTWTLIYNPLTGHADIVEKALDLKDIQTQ
jgi:general secretion pathway protein H